MGGAFMTMGGEFRLQWVGHFQLRWVGQLWQSELLFLVQKNTGLQGSTLSGHHMTTVPAAPENTEV